jgi:hypothetical protein
MVVLMGCCRRRGKRRSNRWRGRSVVERMVVKPAVIVVAAEGTIEKEKEERDDIKKRKTGEDNWFFVNFGLDLRQAMKSTSIYRRWKMVILFTRGENCSHYFSWEGSNYWFKVSTMNC